MQQAMGVLGWSPKAFWKATPVELLAALEGWQEANMIDSPGAGNGSGWSSEEIREMQEMLEDWPDVWID